VKKITLIRTNNDLAEFQNVLSSLDLTKPKLITIEEPISTRTLKQNKLMWLWYSKMRKHISDVSGSLYKTDAIHEEMKELFLDPIVHELKNKVIRRYSTKKLSTKEFTTYLENLDMYCADRLHLILPHPDDIFNEAMGRK